MNKDVTIIPYEKSLREVIMALGEDSKFSWIYIHNSILDDFLAKDGMYGGSNVYLHSGCYEIIDGNARINIVYHSMVNWHLVIRIKCDDIPFKLLPSDPKKIIFLSRKVYTGPGCACMVE